MPTKVLQFYFCRLVSCMHHDSIKIVLTFFNLRLTPIHWKYFRSHVPSILYYNVNDLHDCVLLVLHCNYSLYWPALVQDEKCENLPVSTTGPRWLALQLCPVSMSSWVKWSPQPAWPIFCRLMTSFVIVVALIVSGSSLTSKNHIFADECGW